MEKHITFNYSFKFKDTKEKIFTINLDKDTLNHIDESNTEPAEWTKFCNFRCPHCPIEKDSITYCPVALRLEDIITFFSDFPSFTEANILVTTRERVYAKKGSVQQGVSSLVGLVMASSGCPVMNKLKPLVQFHLPFATLEDTEFRILSMYLVAQFFRWKKGLEPDWSLEKLSHFYKEIQMTNEYVVFKMNSLESYDSARNAVTILNYFANYISFNIESNDFSKLTSSFDEYLKD